MRVLATEIDSCRYRVTVEGYGTQAILDCYGRDSLIYNEGNSIETTVRGYYMDILKDFIKKNYPTDFTTKVELGIKRLGNHNLDPTYRQINDNELYVAFSKE